MLDVLRVLGLLPDLLAITQGRLAEARLTLGYNPQPLQGWCEGRERFGKGDSAFHEAMRRDANLTMHALNRVPFMPGILSKNGDELASFFPLDKSSLRRHESSH